MKKIDIKDLQGNAVSMFDDKWCLITAGTKESYNTMTASWGAMGELWNKDVCFIFIRPQRYTKVFMDREDTYTLTFFDESWKKQLGYLGTVSGRDEKKIEKAGLTPVFGEGTTWFEEAKLVLVCRKLYSQELKEDGFADRAVLERNYPNRDLHTMYIGEIIKVLVQE